MTRAYYNEIDPYAAAWTRNLIAAGHIPAGDVDTRSIVDVRPADLAGYTSCHFFSGIAGWPLALRLAGWPDDRPAWTGSCPCQPLSLAGKRLGHADERHLWPAFHGLIAECKPAIVFGEQVAKKDGREWLAAVRADLEATGYAVGIADLCAAGVGAPHIRQRHYWVADAATERRPLRNERPGDPRDEPGPRATAERRDPPRGPGLAAGPGWQGQQDGGPDLRPQQPPTERAGEDAGGLADLHGDGRSAGARRGLHDAEHHPEPRGVAGRLADADGRNASAEGLQRSGEHGQQPQDGGVGSMVDANGERRNGGGAGAQPETRVGAGVGGGDAEHRPGPLAVRWDDADWLLCRDGKWRPVEPGTFPLAAGIPGRVGRLRAYGNALCVPLAVEFVKAILEGEG